MRENITIQIGKCGIHFGHEFWKQISSEHFIDPDGSVLFKKPLKRKENIYNFFRETSSCKFIPRTILFDLEPREIQNIKNGTYAKLYEDVDVISMIEGSGNNWSNGYIRALEINLKIEEIFRKNSEKCDSIGSFSLFHSITGGTGSGSTCAILEILKEHFPGKIINCYSIIPNQAGQSDIVVQPYNAVLSMRWLYYYADCVTLFENESLCKIIQNENKISRINYNHLNLIGAKIVSTFTYPLRFQNYTETNFESIISSSIPISNLHFLFGSASNLQLLGGKKYIDKIFPENIRQLLKNKTINFNWKSGKLISSMFFFKNRGNININSKISKKIFRDFNISYINWAPVSIQEIKSNFSDLNYNSFGIDCCIFNHTGIKEIFIKIGNQFDILKKRNAFVDNFLKEFSQRDGQEIFEESRESMEKIISAYNND